MAADSAPDLLAEESSLGGDQAPFAGKYEVVRVLGQGGMGIVFEARHIRLGQRVAIKVLGSALREYPELVERFEREARAAGSLTSSHAVRVFDIDATEDGTPFIVMELLAGRDLSSIVERDGPQPVSRAVRWVIEACDAIAEAHRLGIIHRDLKPSNLFLTDVEGRQMVKVLDFGIAKRVSTQEVAITQAVAPLGTPQYMSPEQVRCAKDVDTRTDVWSLGITLYEMVCGSTPFSHDSASACIAAIAADPVPDPRELRADLSDAFVAVLMRALAKSTKDRFQSIEELVKALAPFALDDSCEDEEMVSAVRRAYVLAAGASGPRTPQAFATLDAAIATGSDAPRAQPSVRPPPPAAAGSLRVPFESRSDRTVPPAVSIASVAPHRRFNTILGVAAAAALGLAALVLSPHWGEQETARGPGAPVATGVRVTAAALAVPTAAAEPVPPAEPADENAANADASTVAAPSAPSAPSTPPPANVVAAAATPGANGTSAHAATVPVPAPALSAVGAAHLTARSLTVADKREVAAAPASPPRSGVHGGLSNPGF